MATEGVTTTEGQEVQLSPKAAALAEKGRQGVTAPAVDPLNPPPANVPNRPEFIPEKFWKDGKADLEGLAKSYSELEKRLGSGQAPSQDTQPAATAEDKTDKPVRLGDQKTEGEDSQSGAEGDDTVAGSDADDPVAKFTETQQAAVTAARDAYSQSGELSEDHRKALLDSGFDEATIDTYLEGVKALEKALAAEVYGAAGSEDAYNRAAAWALENWTAEEIAAHDAALGNPALRQKAVKNLMREFGEAEPGEGELTDLRGGSNMGDVFANKEEYLTALREADSNPNVNAAQAARKAVIEKLQRSRKAGTVKMARSGPFQN